MPGFSGESRASALAGASERHGSQHHCGGSSRRHDISPLVDVWIYIVRSNRLIPSLPRKDKALSQLFREIRKVKLLSCGNTMPQI